MATDRYVNDFPYDNYQYLWDDCGISAAALAPGAAAPGVITFGPSGNVRAYGFDGGVTAEYLDGSIQLPHKYEEGTPVRFHIHWAPSTTGAGNVIWKCDYYFLNKDEAPGGAPTTMTATGTAGGTAWQHSIAAFPEISMTGKKISAIMMFSLYRVPNDANDTYGADAALISADIHYRIDSEGSAQEFIK